MIRRLPSIWVTWSGDCHLCKWHDQGTVIYLSDIVRWLSSFEWHGKIAACLQFYATYVDVFNQTVWLTCLTICVYIFLRIVLYLYIRQCVCFNLIRKFTCVYRILIEVYIQSNLKLYMQKVLYTCVSYDQLFLRKILQLLFEWRQSLETDERTSIEIMLTRSCCLNDVRV